MPPDTDTSIVPSLKPKHEFEVSVCDRVNGGDCVIVIVSEAVHPFASDAVTVCVPAPSPLVVAPVWLLLHE